MEMSYCSDDYVVIVSKVEQDLCDLFDIFLDYKVLFLQGGVSQQFVEILLNLLFEDGVVDYIDIGIWLKKVIEEVCCYGIVNVVVSVKEYDYFVILGQNEWMLIKDVVYVYYVFNEIIGGFEFDWIFEIGDVLLVIDMFFDIFLCLFDVFCFGLIYVGVQKNIGLFGLVVVIVCEDLFGCVCSVCLIMFNYKIVVDNGFMYNILVIYFWYLFGLVFEWLKEQGGVIVMEQCNCVKKDLLYKIIDVSDFYINLIQLSVCFWMNVLFCLVDECFDKLFLEGVEVCGLFNLKGYCLVGGMCVFIYNVFGLDVVEVLVVYMVEFEKEYG